MAARILCVCTGNICRSPIAEVLFRRHLESAGVDAVVASAGLIAPGRGADPAAIEVARERGLDLAEHRSRTLDPEILEGADLVVGMAREHVREAVALVPQIWPRAFTLRDLARRAAEAGRRPPTMPLADWLALIGGDRRATDLLGDDHDDDVPDPLGQPTGVFETLTGELDRLIHAVVRHLFPTDAPVPRH